MTRLAPAVYADDCPCGLPAERKLAAVNYCGPCAEAILEPIRERVILREDLDGVGLRVGADCPEFGPGVCDLRCRTCDAGWAGRVGDPCPWCERRRQAIGA